MSYRTTERDKGVGMPIYGDNSNVLNLVAKRCASLLCFVLYQRRSS
jgi:hypothetical protein